MKLNLCIISLVATAVSASALTWHPIDISSQGNANFDPNLINGSTYPTGDQTYGGVPFENTGPFWTSDLAAGANPKVLEVSVGVFGATEVHTLLNTWWGQVGPLSSIEFIGSDTGFLAVDLIGGHDIRDYNQASWVNTINGLTTVEVFNNGSGQRLDKQLFTLPADFSDETLESIRFIDNGDSGVHRLFVAGVTVGVAAAAVPDGGSSLGLLALGSVALAGIRRFAKSA